MRKSGQKLSKFILRDTYQNLFRKTYVYDTKQEKVVPIEERTDISPDLNFRNDKFGKLEAFTPRWYNNICEKPIYVESRSQLRGLLSKHGLVELG